MKYHTIWMFLFLLLPGMAEAQTKVHVVSQEEYSTFPWKAGVELIVTGERAEIDISTHAQNTITCATLFISKHPDLNLASEEITYHQWVTDKIGKKIYLRNYIALPESGEKPQGNLKVLYQIKVPAQCRLTIKNYFGKIALTGISGEVDIISDFSAVMLSRTNADIEVKTKFGDITANEINGALKVISNRGDIALMNIRGIYELDVSTAEVNVSQAFLPDAFQLTSRKSLVRFQIENLGTTDFEINTDQAQFDYPQWMIFETEEQERGKYIINKNGDGPGAVISLQYGKLEISGAIGTN